RACFLLRIPTLVSVVCLSPVPFYLFFFFFFQAEDGIRDLYVTGVQTCALPILRLRRERPADRPAAAGRLFLGSEAPRHRASLPAGDRLAPPRAEGNAVVSWEIVVGLESHTQLLTKSKMFSGGSNAFGAAPNTQVSGLD